MLEVCVWVRLKLCVWLDDCVCENVWVLDFVCDCEGVVVDDVDWVRVAVIV
jgi:hypothetical protein